jgi:ribosomal protein S21
MAKVIKLRNMQSGLNENLDTAIKVFKKSSRKGMFLVKNKLILN